MGGGVQWYSKIKVISLDTLHTMSAETPYYEFRLIFKCRNNVKANCQMLTSACRGLGSEHTDL